MPATKNVLFHCQHKRKHDTQIAESQHSDKRSKCSNFFNNKLKNILKDEIESACPICHEGIDTRHFVHDVITCTSGHKVCLDCFETLLDNEAYRFFKNPKNSKPDFKIIPSDEILLKCPLCREENLLPKIDTLQKSVAHGKINTILRLLQDENELVETSKTRCSKVRTSANCTCSVYKKKSLMHYLDCPGKKIKCWHCHTCFPPKDMYNHIAHECTQLTCYECILYEGETARAYNPVEMHTHLLSHWCFGEYLEMIYENLNEIREVYSDAQGYGQLPQSALSSLSLFGNALRRIELGRRLRVSEETQTFSWMYSQQLQEIEEGEVVEDSS